ncbi:dual specificity protein kinase Ttk-like [Aricia agestis]|uniref:dual specificity protein kinase Ttk-like n=1 Tax=Aricia agestis TaxID=91739 RepID=UPI001C208DFF|nr:dual specificity protein kinase Ttk-like [Aricia agestis]
MNNTTETTSNSFKFAPMPLSALLANLKPLQQEEDTPDSSFNNDESDDSVEEINTKCFATTKVISTSTPQNAKSMSKAVSEKKIHSEHNKENVDSNGTSNQTYPNNQFQNPFQGPHVQKTPSTYLNSERKRYGLVSHDKYSNVSSYKGSALKRTPDMQKLRSTQKTKTATPKIKSGIRKFTPGSSTRKSQKKTPLQTIIQNRDKVRCELFRHPQNADPVDPPPVPVAMASKASITPLLAPTSTPGPAPAPTLTPAPPPPLTPAPPPPLTPAPAPVAATPAIPVSVPASQPVPATPLNKKPIPTSYAATPSYPQGAVGNNSKILFKTTSIKDRKYMFIKKLGTGGSSEVYKVLEVGTSNEYAVKCVYLATDQELAQGYINEVRLLRSLQNSDRVVKLYDYEYDRTNQILRLVLEVGETDLSSILKARAGDLPPALVLHYWEEMLHAVNYIHDHGVIHADLKPANFLLVCGRLKLIDFGIASAISSDATSVVRSQAAGTYSYISPEALTGGAGGYGGSASIKISFRSDVWSLGCILYSMVYGRTPFGHIPNLTKLAVIVNPNHRIEFPAVEHLPQSLISSLKWCLTYNARARPFVRDLLAVKHLQLGACTCQQRTPAPAPSWPYYSISTGHETGLNCHNNNTDH